MLLHVVIWEPLAKQLHLRMVELFAYEIEEIKIAILGEADSDVNGVAAEHALAVPHRHGDGSLALRLWVQRDLHRHAGSDDCDLHPLGADVHAHNGDGGGGMDQEGQ